MACGVEGGVVRVEDSHQRGVHGGQIRALAQFGTRVWAQGATGKSWRKQRGQVSKASLKEWQRVLQRHCWWFVLYIKKKAVLYTPQKRSAVRQGQIFSFLFLTSSQKLDYFVLMECFIKNIYWDTIIGLGTWNTTRFIIFSKVLLKPFTYSHLVIKTTDVHGLLEIAKSIKTKCLKYCIRNCCQILSNAFPALDGFSYLTFLLKLTAY